VHDDTRTPGSDFVLPANPLMNLTDESLVGYVDCTLYEETGNFFPAEDDTTFGDDVAAPPNADGSSTRTDASPRAETPLPLDKPPSAGERPAASRFESNAETEVGPRRDSAPALHTPPSPGTPVVVAPAAAKQTDDEPPSIEIQGVPATAASPVLAPTAHKRQRWMLLGGVGGAAAALVVIVVVVMTSSSDGGTPSPAPPPTPTVKRAPANAALPPADEQPKPTNPVEPPTNEPDDEIPPPTEGAPVVGSGPCKVAVHTTPAGSIVKLDGKSVGPSPLTVAASCGKHKLDIDHPRYAAQSKLVTLTAGKVEDLDVTLSRPTHLVSVTSNPSGAQVFINGRSAGTTPTKLNVLGFVTLNLEFKKTGYQPAATKLYSKRPQDNVSVRLTKW
jgi:hypothetical protein